MVLTKTLLEQVKLILEEFEQVPPLVLDLHTDLPKEHIGRLGDIRHQIPIV